MIGIEIDLDQRCFLTTRGPVQRMGPMVLRTAIRRVVDQRPPAEDVSIELSGGTILDEPEVGAIYVLASLVIVAPAVAGRYAASHLRRSRARP